MDHLVSRLAFASLLLGACSSSGAPLEQEMGLDMEARLIGGWDGASTTGTSVLLLREGLIGSLSATQLRSTERDLRLDFAVSGSISELDEELVLLDLSCAEVRARPHDDSVEGTQEPAPIPSSTDDPTGGQMPPEPAAWEALDCAGWNLQLQCSTAGACGTADCDLFCDIVYFGDSFATASIELAAVEDELDHWERV